MIKFFKLLPYHLKGAFKSIFRNFAMAVSSSMAVTITLLLVMVFIVLAANVNSISTEVQESVRIYVQIDSVVDEADYPALQAEIEAVSKVSKVEFSSKEEQFDILIDSEQAGEGYEIFREENPLLSAYYVDVEEPQDIEKATETIGEIPGVFSASFGGESASAIIGVFEALRMGGAIFVFALCILAIFLISNTIKITIHSRSSEIAIMRQVGADNTFIKTPFMMEGMILGLCGSLVPIAVLIFAYDYVYAMFEGQFFSALLRLQNPYPFVYYVGLGLAGVGVLVGMIGSFLSVNKYLRWKR